MNKTPRTPAALQCKCGYEFVNRPPQLRPFESYALIRDKQYQRFFKAESRVLAATDETTKLRAIATSSELIGSLYECPKCGRLVLSSPGGISKRSYVRDDE